MSIVSNKCAIQKWRVYNALFEVVEIKICFEQEHGDISKSWVSKNCHGKVVLNFDDRAWIVLNSFSGGRLDTTGF